MRYVLAIVCLVPALPGFASDADLHSVKFVDAREGWAVGEDGVILHTIDAGATWERQASGTRASLRAVHFLTPYSGWIVGRTESPGGVSTGIVLATSDGGLKWKIVSSQALPGLQSVKFFTERAGIAAGDSAEGFPTGIHHTQDGGQTWKPLPGKRSAAWHTLDFSDAETGIVAGAFGQIAPVREGILAVADMDPLEGRSIRSVRLHGDAAIAVGSGGAVLVSRNSAGLRWGYAVPKLPREVLAALDFSACAIVGTHLWVAGRPGSIVLHSPDFGKTWEMRPTGQPLPIHSLHFADAENGWAVGAMGSIVHTADGGKTWKTQRQAGQRAALLAVHGRSRSLPLDTIATLGGEEGYRTVSLKLWTDEMHTRGAGDAERLPGVTRSVSGTSAESLWHFPLPRSHESLTPEQLLAAWDIKHDDRAAMEIVRQLVLALRIWRPEVIVTEATGEAWRTAAQQAVLQAFRMAGDAEAFPEQLATLKLEAWQPKKLYAESRPNDGLALSVPTNEWSVQLSAVPADAARISGRGLEDAAVIPSERRYRLLDATLDGAAAHVSLFQGVQLAEGGQARRTRLTIPAVVPQGVRKMRDLSAIARGDAENFAPAAVLARLSDAVHDVPEALAVPAILAVAEQFARTGQWPLAREAYRVLVKKYPSHPLSAEAYRWLVRYEASGEALRREELGHFMTVTETRIEQSSPPRDGSKLVNSNIVQASHREPIVTPTRAVERLRESLEWEPNLQAFGSRQSDDPSLQLCWRTARRKLGDFKTADAWTTRYLKASAAPMAQRGADPWRDAVLAEAWLAHRADNLACPKPITFIAPTARKPYLDGKLDDACWTDAAIVSLTPARGDVAAAHERKNWYRYEPTGYTTTARMTHDREHLYIAVSCTHPAMETVEPVAKRERDADLSGADRVEVLLDLDRDYQTYYRLRVDRRGRVAEDCWGDATWNPQWFVAVQTYATGWSAEIAIPMKELTGDVPNPGTAWATNLTRVIPGKGVQAWSLPADAEPRPEGMGILQFIAEPRR